MFYKDRIVYTGESNEINVSNSNINIDLSLKRQFETYTITYDLLEGGSWQNDYVPPQTYVTYRDLTLPTKSNLITSAENKIFAGWSTINPSDVVDEYPEDNLIVNIPKDSSEDITLYANWADYFNIDIQTPFDGEINNEYTIIKVSGELTNESLLDDFITDIKRRNPMRLTLDFSELTGLKKLQTGYFSNTTVFQRLILPNSLTFIDVEAFINNTSLKEINIPEGVTTIGDSAFFSCSSLKEITIPESVTYIGISAFNNCGNLSQIVFKDPENWYLPKGQVITDEDLLSVDEVTNILEKLKNVQVYLCKK